MVTVNASAGGCRLHKCKQGQPCVSPAQGRTLKLLDDEIAIGDAFSVYWEAHAKPSGSGSMGLVDGRAKTSRQWDLIRSKIHTYLMA